MNPINAIQIVILAVFVYMTLLFILAIRLKRNDIVDIAWGMGFVLISGLYLVLVPSFHWRRILISFLILLWAMRLAIYLYLRNRNKTEDFRYAQWRKDWGKNWLWRSYLQVFILQGFFMLSIAYPVFLWLEVRREHFGIWDLLGIVIWLMGFFFETVGDAQMRKFKQNPANKGKIMNRGLWRYTRHPNYFGESSMWWAIFLLSLGFTNGIWAIFSPLIITTLLVRVSGVPLLEKKYEGNQEYQDYIRNTSSFIPFFPKAK